jgi:hypothetical protein
MRFMIIRRADRQTEAGAKPSEQLIADMAKYNEELVRAGVMLAGDGLQPTSKGALVSFRNGKPTVIDGPFAEAKELIAGYSIFEVASREEAIEWIRRWPVTDADGNAQIEIRQLYEIEDFGDSAGLDRLIRLREELATR